MAFIIFLVSATWLFVFPSFSFELRERRGERQESSCGDGQNGERLGEGGDRVNNDRKIEVRLVLTRKKYIAEEKIMRE